MGPALSPATTPMARRSAWSAGVLTGHRPSVRRRCRHETAVWRRPARTPALHGAAQAGEDAGAPWGRRSHRQPPPWRAALYGAPVSSPPTVQRHGRTVGTSLPRGAGRRGRRRSMGPALSPATTPMARRLYGAPVSSPATVRRYGAAVGTRLRCGAGRRGRRRSIPARERAEAGQVQQAAGGSSSPAAAPVGRRTMFVMRAASPFLTYHSQSAPSGSLTQVSVFSA